MGNITKTDRDRKCCRTWEGGREADTTLQSGLIFCAQYFFLDWSQNHTRPRITTTIPSAFTRTLPDGECWQIPV